MTPQRRYEICGIFVIAVTILLFLALITDGYRGDVRRPLSAMAEAPNLLKAPGALVAGILTILFGYTAHIIYCITFIWGCVLILHIRLDRPVTRVLGVLALVSGLAMLANVDVPLLFSGGDPISPIVCGGMVGDFLASLTKPALGVVASNVVAFALVLIGFVLATEFLFFQAVQAIRIAAQLGFRGLTKGTAFAIGKTFAVLRKELSVLAGRFRAAFPKQRQSTKKKTKKAKAKDERVSRLREAGKMNALLADGAFYDDGVHAPVLERGAGGAEAAALGDMPPLTDAAEPDPVAPFDPVPELSEAPDEEMAPAYPAEQLELEAAAERPRIQAKLASEQPLPRRKITVDTDLPDDYEYPRRYTKPPMDLFDPPPAGPSHNVEGQLRQTSQRLEETFATFGIEAKVTDVTRGPTITRFEVEPAPGIKVNRFVNLADDLALALKAHRVRVEAPIPGKGRVGIEVPNKIREAVVIRELLESKTFRKSSGALPLAMGKDIAGDVIVADLAGMPHLLVAGATGAGKTVCVKTMIASLLCSHTPEELQVMLVDPKMVELSIFDDIPHLITPVVTDPKKAAISLRWLISEMEERYRLFTHLRVRNIEVYNQSVANGEIEMPGSEGAGDQSVDVIRKLPYIVCIIDELADLMMLARAEVEDCIARLAQLARAVGIHLIIATQRPSVDVLTGVIKANFPARLSFQVSSKVDSRCILDQIGAERLIGRGDLLYLPAGYSKPLRVQGAFVSDDEMNNLIAYLKTQAPPQYRDEIEKFGKDKEVVDALDDQDDELFDEAVRVVLETGQASISMVQRRLRVGYTRAARLIDMMELRGIVGPHMGSKAREILVHVPPNDEVA